MNRLSDRSFCRQLGHECEAALRAVAEKHGLTVAYHGGSLGVGSFVAKLEFAESDREQREFNEFYCLLGLVPSDFGAVITVQGQPHRVVGIRPNSVKMPIIIERVSDKQRYTLARTAVAKIVSARPMQAVPS